MRVFHTFAELRAVEQPIHWAIGFFDGVHTGHVRVMHSAASPGALRGVLTFECHPLALLRPSDQPKLLTPNPQHKNKLIERLGGAEVLLRLPFTPELAALSPVQFLDALTSACRVAGISVGANWHFGSGAVGDAQFLVAEGTRRDIHVCICPLADYDGAPISSRRIRAALSAGQLPACSAMLGHPFCIVGTVEYGQQLGRRLGFPTANLSVPPHSALPPAGVYAVSCPLNGAPQLGIANLGLRPTINECRKLPRLEVHFPNWQGDLYGHMLCVEFSYFIRPERKFPSLDALQRQISADVRKLSDIR